MLLVFFFKQKTAYEMRISDWSSDVCSSDLVGLAVLVGDHAHDLVAAHFRLEAAADAAIGAGGDHRMLGLADLDDRFFRQRGGRAGLHAGAAGNAFGGEEILGHAGRYLGIEAARLDGQRKGALHFLAGPHTARADRKSVVEGKSVSVRVDLGGRRHNIKKKKEEHTRRIAKKTEKQTKQ